ncbi:MAG TPA: hypothetical protein VMW50_04890 [Dehalococcoidia bacterium]|nr:hypothetical protein [Dehalococcoidia bacterium]
MPSKTQKQARFMAAAAHNPKFAKKVGIKQGVAKEFNRADTGTKRLSKAMKNRKKYAQGGLATMLKNKWAPQMAVGGQVPPRRMVPPSMPPQGGQPVGMMDPRQRIPGGQPPQGGGLAQMIQRARSQQQSGGARPGMPPQGPAGGMRGFMDQLRQRGGAGGFPGPTAGPQQPQGALSRIAGRLPATGGQNGLLRSAQGAYRNPGNRMMGGAPRAQFAAGGRVRRAIKALNGARSMLTDSDPDFDHIADLLAKEVPEASHIAEKIKKTANAEPKTSDPDEFRDAWLSINKQLKELKAKLKEAKE